MSILVDGSLPTTSTEVQNQGVIESTSLNLHAMEQSPGLKNNIIRQLHDVFHVQFHGTLKADYKHEINFLKFYVSNPSPTTPYVTHLAHPACSHLPGHEPFP